MSLNAPLRLPSEARLAALRKDFARRGWVRLPGLLRGELLARVEKNLKAAKFSKWELGSKGEDVRETPEDDFLNVAVPVLLNDPRLFRVVEAVCGKRGVRRLTGRFYRSRPAAGHKCGWHQDDEAGARLASMTVCAGRFTGGALELRKTGAERGARVPYGKPGDALLFAISPELEHRSGPVTGRRPKDILACWFHLK